MDDNIELIELFSLTPKKKPKKNVQSANDVMYWGEDNLLPQEILKYYNYSTTNAGILNKKIYLGSGNGFEFTNPEAEVFAKKINFTDLFKKAITDFFLYNAFSLEIIPNVILDRINTINYVDTSYVRLKCHSENILISACQETYDKDIIEIKQYDENDPFMEHSVLFYRRISPGYSYYSIPSYFSAFSWIRQELELKEYSENLIFNSFTPTQILKLPNKLSPESKEALKKKIKNELTGAKNAGKILTIEAEGEKVIEIIPLSQNIDSTQLSGYLDLVRKNIIVGHSLPSPTIIGLEGGASLGGDGGTIDIGTKLFFKTEIYSIQNELKKVFEDLFKRAGFETEIIIKNEIIIE